MNRIEIAGSIMFLLRACLRSGGGRIASARAAAPPPAILRFGGAAVRRRPLSSSGSGSGSGGDRDRDRDREDDRSFFLKDEESLPPPPSYVRDAVTGKWTDETRPTLSSKDRRLLNLDAEGRSDEAMARLEERWRRAAEKAAERGEGEGGEMGGGGPGPGMALHDEHERVARRIAEERLALGTVGREPSDRVKERGDGEVDGADAGEPEAEAPLTPREHQALKAYAAREHGISPKKFARLAEDDPDLIPHNSVSSGGDGAADPKKFFDADLDLAYLQPRMHRRAFADRGGDDPFADLLPSDLNPARKVNRRLAKPIPPRLLHHNNLSLLRRYTTPGGKIMNRVQSRLGAKDQRKIAKLVKRARHLGLIPHLGQWKFEDHGDVREAGLAEADAATVGEAAEGKRDWEAELERRGLWPLTDETAVTMRHYGVENMLDRMGGPRGSKKRKELEELLGGPGALVPDEAKV